MNDRDFFYVLFTGIVLQLVGAGTQYSFDKLSLYFKHSELICCQNYIQLLIRHGKQAIYEMLCLLCIKKKKSQSSWARAGVATIHCPMGSRNLLSLCPSVLMKSFLPQGHLMIQGGCWCSSHIICIPGRKKGQILLMCHPRRTTKQLLATFHWPPWLHNRLGNVVFYIGVFPSTIK